MIPFTSNNCLIGSWSDTALQFKKQLLKFVQDHKAITFQQGSVNINMPDHQRYWEYGHALAFTQPVGKRVLDAGGANSLLSWYLATIGVDVVSIDLIEKNIRQGLMNNKRLKLDNISFLNQDVNKMKYEDEFDYVYCINVIEHVMEHARGGGFKPGLTVFWNGSYKPSEIEIETEQTFVKNLAKCLKPGGVLALSYDYKKFGRYRCQPRCAYMRSPGDVQSRIIEPSGLNIFGDTLDFTEDLAEGKRSASAGMIFLQKNATQD